MKLRVVQPAKHSECRSRQCKDHFQYHNEYVVSVVEDFLGDQDQDQDQDSFLGDHPRVSPAAVAGAAVHMVCMCCPLLIRVPENVLISARRVFTKKGTFLSTSHEFKIFYKICTATKLTCSRYSICCKPEPPSAFHILAEEPVNMLVR